MYKGTGASAGIGIGTAVVVEESELVIERREISDIEAEIQRFRSAVDRDDCGHGAHGAGSGFAGRGEGSGDNAGAYVAAC